MFRVIAKFVYAFLLIVESLLIVRIVLVLITAPTSNQLVSFIYKWSSYFISPVVGIGPGQVDLEGLVIDVTAFIALLFYMLLAFIIMEIARAFST